MKFFLDHDVPDEIGWMLTHWGHEVTLLRDVMSITTPDEKIFAYVCEKGLIVITCNRNHFLALATDTTLQPGLIILIRRLSRQTECSRLRFLLHGAGESGIANNINFA